MANGEKKPRMRSKLTDSTDYNFSRLNVYCEQNVQLDTNKLIFEQKWLKWLAVNSTKDFIRIVCFFRSNFFFLTKTSGLKKLFNCDDVSRFEPKMSNFRQTSPILGKISIIMPLRTKLFTLTLKSGILANQALIVHR